MSDGIQRQIFTSPLCSKDIYTIWPVYKDHIGDWEGKADSIDSWCFYRELSLCITDTHKLKGHSGKYSVPVEILF